MLGLPLFQHADLAALGRARQRRRCVALRAHRRLGGQREDCAGAVERRGLGARNWEGEGECEGAGLRHGWR